MFIVSSVLVSNLVFVIGYFLSEAVMRHHSDADQGVTYLR